MNIKTKNMKYVILPIWKLVKVGFRFIGVMFFIITAVVLFILHTLWELKLDFSYFGEAKDSFLKELSYSEFETKQCHTPKGLWDYIYNGLKKL
jgi:hypothetical protein